MFVVEKNNSIMFTLIDYRRETRDERRETRETTNAEGERSRGCSHTHDRAQHLVYEPKANIQRREKEGL